MFTPALPVDATGALLWLAGIAVAGFLVAWLFTDLMRIPRTPYVAILALATGGLTAGYMVWSDAGASFWTTRWEWGVVAALLGGALLAVMVARMLPRTSVPAGNGLPGAALLWEGGVYGAAEGLLLSALPVVVTWQALNALGWPGAAAALLALIASQAVIVVHHLGYRGYRGRRMLQPVIGCTVVSLAYLLTGSLVAPIGAHIVLHTALLGRGVEMPPHQGAIAEPAPLALGRHGHRGSGHGATPAPA